MKTHNFLRTLKWLMTAYSFSVRLIVKDRVHVPYRHKCTCTVAAHLMIEFDLAAAALAKCLVAHITACQTKHVPTHASQNTFAGHFSERVITLSEFRGLAQLARA